ncbi:SET domain-containing protein [Xylariomycetidae sp. FL2044]|nr:SET domain-containing protein [Xylariomycetidae sp. FL2044]
MKLHSLISVWALARLSSAKLSYQSWLEDHRARSSEKCLYAPHGPLKPARQNTECPLVIDDETAAATDTWHPWSLPPVCVKAQNEKDSKLCVFTYVNLRGEAGISILTTPENAASGIQILRDQDLGWVNWGKDQEATIESFPPPYEIREIEDKGLGVVANRSIERGEIVMIRYPVLLRKMDLSLWSTHDRLQLLHRAAIQLPPNDGSQMLTLAKSKGGYIVDDIINTNSFGVLLDGVDHQGLYVEVSRINHACRPNMFSRFSATSLAMEVVAYRDVEKGEELTFSYTPLNLLSHQRRPMIEGWGFNCTCSLCSSPKDLDISDRQRNRIQKLLVELDQPEIRTHEKVHERIVEITELCVREGITAQLGDFYNIISDIYLDMGDVGLARKYGEMAVKELRYYAGYDHERTEKAMLFLETLEAKKRR